MQDNQPTTFISEAFSLRTQTKSVYEKELITVMYVVWQWQHHLEEIFLIIRTDQRSLKYL